MNQNMLYPIKLSACYKNLCTGYRSQNFHCGDEDMGDYANFVINLQRYLLKLLIDKMLCLEFL